MHQRERERLQRNLPMHQYASPTSRVWVENEPYGFQICSATIMSCTVRPRARLADSWISQH